MTKPTLKDVVDGTPEGLAAVQGALERSAGEMDRIQEGIGSCTQHGQYHVDHGCGTAVKVGSSYAEHCLRCAFSPIHSSSGGFFAPNDSNCYAAWEAPAGNCPYCWHAKD